MGAGRRTETAESIVSEDVDASTVSAGIAAVSAAISPGGRRVPDLVPHRSAPPGRSGVAALPGGFTCPRCGHGVGWRLGDGRTEFARCSSRTPVTAGTIVDRTHTPLTVWFTACWLFATQKDGISALSLQRALEIGSYQTACAMPGRPRSVLVRPGRDRLSGTAEVDETYIGGEEPGLRGGRQEGPHRHRGGGQRAEGDRPATAPPGSGISPASSSRPPPRSSISTTPASTSTNWPPSPSGCCAATARTGSPSGPARRRPRPDVHRLPGHRPGQGPGLLRDQRPPDAL